MEKLPVNYEESLTHSIRLDETESLTLAKACEHAQKRLDDETPEILKRIIRSGLGETRTVLVMDSSPEKLRDIGEALGGYHDALQTAAEVLSINNPSDKNKAKNGPLSVVVSQRMAAAQLATYFLEESAVIELYDEGLSVENITRDS